MNFEMEYAVVFLEFRPGGEESDEGKILIDSLSLFW